MQEKVKPMAKAAVTRCHKTFSAENIKNFTKTSLLGGFLVIFPVAALMALMVWLFKLVSKLLTPITNVITDTFGFNIIVADSFAILAISALCFFVGVFVKTTFGNWMHKRFDKALIKLAPGYKMLRGIVTQFFGDEGKSPLSQGEPAFVKIFGVDVPTELTAFIVAYNEKRNRYSVFAPSAPNPTSGYVYHVTPEQVTIMQDVSAEEALRTIIGCGVGSDVLIEKVAEVKETLDKLGENPDFAGPVGDSAKPV